MIHKAIVAAAVLSAVLVGIGAPLASEAAYSETWGSTTFTRSNTFGGGTPFVEVNGQNFNTFARGR